MIKKILIIIAMVLMMAFPSGVSAQATNTFGGFVPFSVFCTCSGNWLIVVGPPKPGFFSYVFTPQYANYRLPGSGIWTLGTYTSGGTCNMYYGVSCGPFIPPFGTISNLVGTSN